MYLASLRPLKKLLIPLVIIAVLWIGFVPVQLGGSVSYIIINGNSMEPEIKKGDLVVARKSPSYQLDQRVVYDHPRLGYVFHRIVDQADSGFILKGDNNDWLDTYHPLQDEILGKFWYAFPGAGKIIQSFREPVLFSLFVLIISSLLVGLVLMPDPGPTDKRKRKRKKMSQDPTPLTFDDFRQEILLVLAGIAAVALIFGLIATNKPAKMTVTDDLFYQQTGELTYSATAPGTVYDSAVVETGDPVYPGLTCVIGLDFAYQFSSPRLQEGDGDQFGGSFSLWAEIRDNDGWHRTFPLVPEVEISSQKVAAKHLLDICHVLDLIENKEVQTGVLIKTYTLSILPMIKIEGELDGLPLVEEFHPVFVFDLNQTVLRVPPANEGFKIEQEGVIPHSIRADNLMGLFGKQVPVLGVRRVAYSILGICLLAAIYPTWSLYQEWNDSERSRIELQHRPVMIDLKGSQIRKEEYTVIDLETMADLRKLADRYGAMIMHETEGTVHRYLVMDEGFLYQFETEEEIESVNSNEKGKESEVNA